MRPLRRRCATLTPTPTPYPYLYPHPYPYPTPTPTPTPTPNPNPNPNPINPNPNPRWSCVFLSPELRICRLPDGSRRTYAKVEPALAAEELARLATLSVAVDPKAVADFEASEKPNPNPDPKP